MAIIIDYYLKIIFNQLNSCFDVNFVGAAATIENLNCYYYENYFRNINDSH